MKRIFISAAALAVVFSTQLFAEVKELKISKQYGLPYLPLLVLEKQKLIEKNAQKNGVSDLKVDWITFTGGSDSNDALLSGNVHLI